MAAVLVNGGRVLSVGLNKTHAGVSKDKRYGNKQIHAELSCVLGVDERDLKGAILYVAGETRAGNPIKSAPCEICQQMLSELPLKAIYYHNKENEVLKHE